MSKDKGLITRVPLSALFKDKGFKDYLRDIHEDMVKRVGGFLLSEPLTRIISKEGGYVAAHNLPSGGVSYFMVPCEPAFESTPTWAEVPLFGVPPEEGVQAYLRSLGYQAKTLCADAGGVLGDFEWTDDSNSDTDADILAGYDFTAATVKVMNQVWSGRLFLEAGDSVNLEMTTDGGISTPGTGHGILVGYNIEQRLAY